MNLTSQPTRDSCVLARYDIAASPVGQGRIADAEEELIIFDGSHHAVERELARAGVRALRLVRG